MAIWMVKKGKGKKTPLNTSRCPKKFTQEPFPLLGKLLAAAVSKPSSWRRRERVEEQPGDAWMGKAPES